MTTSRRITTLAMSLLLLATLTAGDALAQRRNTTARASTRSPGLTAPVEFSVTYGSMWGGNVSMTTGWIRLATGESWGFTLGLPVAHDTAIELNYTRQSGGLNQDTRTELIHLTDMSVNYWQIGGIQGGLIDASIRPFLLGYLGATHYSPTESSVEIDGTDYRLQSMTKFSLTLGVGLKAFFGENQKVGLRMTLKTMPTFYNTGGSLWIGSGGASLGLYGEAIWQWEVAAGLTIRLVMRRLIGMEKVKVSSIDKGHTRRRPI